MRTLCFLISVWPCLLFSNVIKVGPNGDFETLGEAAPFAIPGDTLLLEGITFTQGTQFIENMNGTPDNPIVIMGIAGLTILEGDVEAIHLSNCSYIVIENIIAQKQIGNGINIDDGGNYDSPTHHITVRHCVFQDMAANANNDFLKLSGLNDFLIEYCSFIRGGGGGSGIDMVGCHNGLIRNCLFDKPGTSGIQAKGGTDQIKIVANTFLNVSQRGINIGGSTGLEFFRPPLSDPIVDAYEASEISVYANLFYRNWAPIAFVGTVDSEVINNTIINPRNWVFRILQETTIDGFLTCSNNTFANNIVYLENDLTEVNIGPNTDPASFTLSNNLWYNNSESNWSPQLPVEDSNQIVLDPLLVNSTDADFLIFENSPAIGAGRYYESVTQDIEGNPFLDPPTVGAFEAGVFSGIQEPDIDNIVFYPNPANSEVCIKNLSEPSFSFKLLNLRGQTVYEMTCSSFCVELPALSNGLYLIQINERVLVNKYLIIKNN